MLRPEFFIDPSSLGPHQDPTERNGIIYTGGAGFIDTAHLRYCCDNTKAAYDRIKAVNGLAGTVITTPEGAATIAQTIPPNLWTKVARDISYDDGLTHEISSYWIMNWPVVRAAPFPGETNSSFSPEDLCSNNLGTYIAETAINIPAGKSANFNQDVTTLLNNVLNRLNAQLKIETQNAWNLINNCWMDLGGMLKLNYVTLKRRNFSFVPWKTGHMSDFPTPSWVTQAPGAGAYYYHFKSSSLAKNIQTTTFNARIQEIRNDAVQRYGPKYDQPTCP